MTRTATLIFLVLAFSLSHAQAEGGIAANPDRMEQRIRALSEFGANDDGGVDRVAFSEADIAGRAYIAELMREAGLAVRLDTAANLIGRREGAEPGLPPIVFGSHIDSVPGGGNYDGDVGVIGALEVIDLLNENRIRTQHPLEVVVFVDEEGGLTGSALMAGKLESSALSVMSHSGLTIGEGIRVLGGDTDRLEEARREPGDIKAFVELHIEQGAILDEEDIDIGVVEGIVGIRWWDVTVEGFANHAGTTPMNRRVDAMVSAAEYILAVNSVATRLPGSHVATVGRIQAEPGAPNVIPGRVVLSLEIRDLSAEKMQTVFDRIEAEAQRISAARGSVIRHEEIDVAAAPAPTDESLRRVITAAAEDLGLSFKHMPSGAGHDAQDMALIAPTGMIFVPSAKGISHSPQEYTSPEDMANGASVLMRTILAIDDGALE